MLPFNDISLFELGGLTKPLIFLIGLSIEPHGQFLVKFDLRLSEFQLLFAIGLVNVLLFLGFLLDGTQLHVDFGGFGRLYLLQHPVQIHFTFFRTVDGLHFVLSKTLVLEVLEFMVD